MPIVQFIPSVGAWSIPPTTPPATVTLPAAARVGSIIFSAVSPPCSGTPQGVVFQLRLDGVLVYTTACMVNGTDSFPVPANTVTVNVTAAFGCNGGADPTIASFSGAGP